MYSNFEEISDKLGEFWNNFRKILKYVGEKLLEIFP